MRAGYRSVEPLASQRQLIAFGNTYFGKEEAMPLRHRARITSRGRVTIPAAARKFLELQPGDTVGFTQIDGEVAIVKPSGADFDHSAGVLSEYAYTRKPDPDEERKWVVQRIAETADHDSG